VFPALVDNDGKLVEGEGEGNLVLTDSWPGQMRTVYGDHERFIQTYFSPFKGYYFSGDGARRDADGYYWITGRVDDVINVSGHRMGTAEVESALVAHPKVAEAAVVGMPHDLKGQGIYAYVTLTAGEEPSDALRKELVAWVRKEIGPIASPDAIQWAPGLPKTRSGKIMRRILRKIAANETDSLGDTRRSPIPPWCRTWWRTGWGEALRGEARRAAAGRSARGRRPPLLPPVRRLRASRPKRRDVGPLRRFCAHGHPHHPAPVQHGGVR
jgi:acyl-coenzyme A synthetase/AMP-(fatty) acid ligase